MSLPEFREALFLLRTIKYEAVEDLMDPREYHIFSSRPAVYFERASYDMQCALWEIVEPQLRYGTRKLAVVA